MKSMAAVLSVVVCAQLVPILYLLIISLCPGRSSQALSLPAAAIFSLAALKCIRELLPKGASGKWIMIATALTAACAIQVFIICACTNNLRSTTTSHQSEVMQSIEVMYIKARLAESQGSYREAEYIYKKLLLLSEFEPDLNFAYGNLLLKLSRKDEALKYLRKAFALYPSGNPARNSVEQKIVQAEGDN